MPPPRDEPRTLLEQLKADAGRTWPELELQFARQAQLLDERVSVTWRHLQRLAAGQIARPGGAVARVLENQFGMPIGELLGPPSRIASTSAASNAEGASLKAGPCGSGAVEPTVTSQPGNIIEQFALDIGQASDMDNRLTRAEFLRLAASAAAGAAVLPDIAANPPVNFGQERSLLTLGSWSARTSAAVLNPMDAVRSWANKPATSGAAVPLRSLIDNVMLRSLAADYSRLDRILPGLLGRVELAVLYAKDEISAFIDLADVYTVIGWVLIKADDTAGSWAAVQRAIHAAECSGDVIRVAAATRCLAEVHMRFGNYEKATRTALVASVGLDRSARAANGGIATAVRGAALLSAAAAAARNGEKREAYASLEAASRCAEEIGVERYDLATVFGPVNVAIHRVAVAVELGDAHTALRHSSDLQLEGLPAGLAERRARALLDVARAQTAVSDLLSALSTLLEAEKISADEVRPHRITRQLLLTLSHHDRRGSGLRELAQRCGVSL